MKEELKQKCIEHVKNNLKSIDKGIITRSFALVAPITFYETEIIQYSYNVDLKKLVQIKIMDPVDWVPVKILLF